MKLRIGTRCSKLALIQAESVKQNLLPYFDQLDIIKIKTSGDMIKKPLYDCGGKGLFIKELENALINKSIDIAVHSMKDIPGFYHQDLDVMPVLKRHSVNDVFISFKYKKLDDLPIKAKIGTCAPRRIAQLRKDLTLIPIRGNIETRLKKAKELDGIILAKCALERLGIKDLMTQVLSTETMLPAVCQGIIAVQFRKNDHELAKILDNISDQETNTAATAERSFLKYINGDCITPLAALAVIKKDTICLKAMLSYQNLTLFKSISGLQSQAKQMGKSIAKSLIKATNYKAK